EKFHPRLEPAPKAGRHGLVTQREGHLHPHLRAHDGIIRLPDVRPHPCPAITRIRRCVPPARASLAVTAVSTHASGSIASRNPPLSTRRSTFTATARRWPNSKRAPRRCWAR